MDRSELARHFDHTCLRADAGAADIAALCEEAIREGCATVCVNPRRVEQADGLVTGSAVSVCTVIGFPLGATTPKAKACEAERARRDGATEFDMVMDLGGFLDGRHASVRSDIQTVRDVTTGMVLKVILETALLDPVQIRAACLLAVDAGADFVKTSTGFGPAGASLEAVRIMREAVGEAAAVKASGGIRDLESVLAFLAAGAVRIGSSSTVTILDELGGDAVSDLHPLEWIETKKRGGEHAPGVLRALIDAVTDGSMPDYQLAAWLMAAWQRGLSPAEILALTEAMRDSGRVLTHPSGPGPTADKHSTGGVGDKASLVVAPLAAVLGLRVPMISGRGLGHTGGTLDKMGAIAGYRVDLDPAEFSAVLASVGCSIIGQTDDLAPADRRLYALRDVTGTVDCVGLIVSSILSKKLAAGPAHLVVDLKCGSGAFMQDRSAAHELARALIDTGNAAGLRTSALLTDMDQPLGEAIGHSLEVLEALECLRGRGPSDLRELSIELATEMARLAGLGEVEALRRRCAGHLDDGSALERFRRMVVAHGAAEDFEDRLDVAPEVEPVRATRGGFVRSMRADEIGRAVIDLGGGRIRHSDRIDLSVGLLTRVRIGDAVEEGQPLFAVHARDDARAAAARDRIRDALQISDEGVPARSVVIDRLSA